MPENPIHGVTLRRLDEGVILWIKARPGAKQNALRGVHNGMLRVAVTQAPEKGKANAAISKFLARLLEIPSSDVQIVKGEAQTEKQILVTRIDIKELSRKLDALLNDSNR